MTYRHNKSSNLLVREPNEQLSLGFEPLPVSISDIVSPTGYTGLSAFHRYWGKKPIECLGFLVETLTNKDDLVLDPFVGSGLLARECAIRGRRFIGIDINPFAVELARLLSDLPGCAQYSKAVDELERTVRPTISDSYRLADGRTATHYLWDCTTLKEVWIAGKGRNGRQVLAPSDFDSTQTLSYENYTSRLIRPLRFFQNARINTSPSLGLSDLFTGRALHNIDLLLQHIHTTSGKIRRSLLLTLTASVGQMSNMVFAITGRGKTKGRMTGKVEVGSWVIGYWRPPLHFEINVWNCFQRRAQKLSKTLTDLGTPPSFCPTEDASAVLDGASEVALVRADANDTLRRIPDGSVNLVLTDPPHSDRIPYLELSEIWNALLGQEADFNGEIVVSNARERAKTKACYNKQMEGLMLQIERILRPNGILALLFNARDAESWNSLAKAEAHASLSFLGCFPMSYSANSVVQDTRRGAMKSDYVLLYVKRDPLGRVEAVKRDIEAIPGWSSDFPQAKGE